MRLHPPKLHAEDDKHVALVDPWKNPRETKAAEERKEDFSNYCQSYKLQQKACRNFDVPINVLIKKGFAKTSCLDSPI